MNVLYLYNSTQTFTNTVFEHLAGFSRYSEHRSFFCHQDQFLSFKVDLSQFDAVVLHYTIRLPFDHVSDSTAKALEQYSGLKVLFIQDEYDHTHKVWKWIKRLGFKLVFTVVPPDGISRVYPPEEFPDVRFVSNLTGYVPEELPCLGMILPPSERKLIVGYRGRPLPIRYGQLGQEKIRIGQLVKQYCDSKGIRNDISWTEDARIYGQKWYEFMASCRAMLGSESGSNVFAWDDSLVSRIEGFRKSNPRASEDDIYKRVVEPCEIPELMNQVSPRVFEAIALRTALILFEGNYSEVVSPGLHYIPLKKDGSNLDEVFTLLKNGAYIDKMTERAYQDVITSGKYSYQTFVQMVDEQIAQTIETLNLSFLPNTCISHLLNAENVPPPLTTHPIRALPPLTYKLPTSRITLKNHAYRVWGLAPERVRVKLKPILKKLLLRE